ncbi:MAG: hypothetical protein ACJ75B_15355 [Flavisolibacter sp.]
MMPPEKEILLDYPAQKIAASLNELVKLPDFILRDTNENMDEFRIAIIDAHRTGLLHIILTSLEDNKTHCFFEMSNTVGGTESESTLAALQHKFMQSFTDHLKGKMTVPTEDKKGCIPVIFFLIVLGFWIFKML